MAALPLISCRLARKVFLTAPAWAVSVQEGEVRRPANGLAQGLGIARSSRNHRHWMVSWYAHAGSARNKYAGGVHCLVGHIYLPCSILHARTARARLPADPRKDGVGEKLGEAVGEGAGSFGTG